MSYQGYENYETWLIALWIENDEFLYNNFHRVANCGDDIDTIADYIKQEVEDNNPITDNSIYTDLLNSALANINWYEVAESLIDKDTDEKEDEVQ